MVSGPVVLISVCQLFSRPWSVVRGPVVLFSAFQPFSFFSTPLSTGASHT